MRIEFGELRIDESAKRNLMDVVNTNWASGGPKVKKFEGEWGKLFDYKHNVAVSSGTSADISACMALYDFGAKRGDEIIAPALAFAAVGESILAAGFNPVFADIRRDTLNIDPSLIEERITDKTRAIMAVHTMGKPAEMDKICDIAREYDLKVIEDSCEAHGASYKGKTIGKWGDMSCFSYYIAHLVCCGEGGMVSTDNDEIADVLRSVRTHGRKDGQLYFNHVRMGHNAKMNDMEASIGLSEIVKFEDTFRKRKKNLYHLMKATENLQEFAYFNTESADEIVCPHAFSVTLKDSKYDAKRFSEYLKENSINPKRNFGSMPTQHKAFEFLGHRVGDFPESEFVGDNGIHFGVHQYLTEDDMAYASEVLHNYFKKL